jgi:excisionase family DNA binding protein
MAVPSSTGMDWFSTKEAAQYLGITPRTLYRLIDVGQVPAYKMGASFASAKSGQQAPSVQALWKVGPRSFTVSYRDYFWGRALRS